jgi:hypothetical protein
VSAPANYDLNEVFDALAAVWNGMDTGDTVGGQSVRVIAEAEVAGDIQTPAIVLELDDLTYDLSMGGGADEFIIVATVLVSGVEDRFAQRRLRSFLSRKGGDLTVGRLKTVLEASETLGDLVSYARVSNMRRFGRITYDNVDYLGAELIVEVMS